MNWIIPIDFDLRLFALVLIYPAFFYGLNIFNAIRKNRLLSPVVSIANFSNVIIRFGGLKLSPGQVCKLKVIKSLNDIRDKCESDEGAYVCFNYGAKFNSVMITNAIEVENHLLLK